MHRATCLASFALIIHAVCAAAQSDEIWTYTPHGRLCPVHMPGAVAHHRAPLLPTVELTIAPAPPADDIAEAPTRVGFAADGRFVCCHAGADEVERCEITDLSSGAFERIEADGAEFALVPAAPNWPLPQIGVHWSSEVDEWTTSLKAELHDTEYGIAQKLYEIRIAEPGSLVLWGVRPSPDGTLIALIHHAYFGENSDSFPVVLISVRDRLAQFLDHASRAQPDAAAYFKALSQEYFPP